MKNPNGPSREEKEQWAGALDDALVRNKVELWIRHQKAPIELEDLAFYNDPGLFWCLQTKIPVVEWCGDFNTVMQTLVRRLDRFVWRSHGDLIVIPESYVGLVYASYIQTRDLGNMKSFSCSLGLHWACLDLKRFLSLCGDHPLDLEAPAFVTDVLFLETKKGFVGL